MMILFFIGCNHCEQRWSNSFHSHCLLAILIDHKHLAFSNQFSQYPPPRVFSMFFLVILSFSYQPLHFEVLYPSCNIFSPQHMSIPCTPYLKKKLLKLNDDLYSRFPFVDFHKTFWIEWKLLPLKVHHYSPNSVYHFLMYCQFLTMRSNHDYLKTANVWSFLLWLGFKFVTLLWRTNILLTGFKRWRVGKKTPRRWKSQV